MHVALIANTAWLDEELSMFGHLAVGLMDEGVGVARVAPERWPEQETGGFGQWVEFADTRWAGLQRRRVANLAGRLKELGVDLIHALDGRLWAGAADLAEKMNGALVVSAWSEQDVAVARRMARRLVALQAGVTAGTDALAEAVREAVGPGLPVGTVRPGVHLTEPPGARNDSESLCTVISGAWTYDRDYRALFTALRPLVKERPGLLFFLDTQGSRQHLIWRAAREMELLSNISFTPRRLGHRELLLKADALIHPQAQARARGLTLQAMAGGTPVLARADPWLDYLEKGTAWLVEEPEAEAWSAVLRRLLDRPEEARALGLRAREWVGEHHLAAEQVGRTLEIYQRVAGKSLKFPAGGSDARVS